MGLALGETKTCTITNNDQPATLIVKKVVVNDNGGTKVASDFSFQVNGGAAQAFEADGQNDLRCQRRDVQRHRACSRRVHDDVQRLPERRARPGRDEDLHGHKRRPARRCT